MRGGAVLGKAADLARDAVEPVLLSRRPMFEVAAETVAQAADRGHQRLQLVRLHGAEPRHGAIQAVAERAHRGLQFAALLARAERRLVPSPAQIVSETGAKLGNVVAQLVEQIQHHALTRAAARSQQGDERQQGRQARQPHGIPDRVDRHHAF